MSMNIKVVNWLSLLTTVMVVALSVSSFFIYSISSWTLISLVGLIMLLGLSFFRYGNVHTRFLHGSLRCFHCL